MNASKNIFDFFKVQNTNLSCPACGSLISKSKLNIHLDSECSSSLPSNKKLDNNVSHGECSSSSNKTPATVNSLKWNKSTKIVGIPKDTLKTKSSRTNRLSLKQQRINANRNIGSLNTKCATVSEIITLDDDDSSSINTNNVEASTLINSKINEDNSAVVSKNQLPSSPIKNNTESLKSQHLEIDDARKYSSSKNRKIEFLNSRKNTDKMSVKKLCHASISENSKSSKHESLLESEIITLDETSSPTSIDNVTSDTLNNVKIKDSLEKIEVPLSAINSENELTLITNNAKRSGSQCSNVDNNQKYDSSKCEKLESLNSHVTTQEAPVNIVQHSPITENGPSNKQENLPVNTLSHSTEGFESVTKSEMNSDVLAMLNDLEGFPDADNVFAENSGNKEHSENYSPYYIANFKHILNAVLNDDFNKVLFNEEDMSFVKAFEALSDSAQKLYVRLFQRKYKWLRLNKINYPNITKEPAKVLDELVHAELVDLGSDKIDLETALDLLSLPEAKTVAKQYKFNFCKSKADIAQKLLKHCKEHKSVFFCNGRNAVSNMMLKKVKDILGPCYRISVLPKRLFTRILMLFSLPTMSEDDDDAAGGQQQQLLTLLQVNKGELTFPDYKINREMKIFIERDELIRYEEAKQIENDIINAVENKNFELAKELYITAKEEFETQLACPFVERSASLPSFLKKYTSFHVYVRCLTQGVEILQRLRQYKEAVDLLERLLNQEVFCQDYRGRWWDRIALNLEQHLKQRQQALEAIKKGIKDKNVRAGHRHSLLTRALRILKSVDEKDELKNEILEAANVIEAPKVVIRGRLFPRNILGRRHVFISSSSSLADEDDITVLGVEQLAIEHYKNEGFSEGIHGESSTFHSLYGLLFWDIIYDGDIPDAFISPYQHHPLDLNHDSFFIRREKQIISHLENLRASTIEELKEIVKSSWEAHFGQTSLVMWDRFTDVEHALGLVSCMGNELLCGICERLARDFRFTRSGVPDLVVWNPETLQVKIVEVKGPGDKLSSKQILWLDYLLKLGAQAEVCHVEAVGSKKLRKE